MCRKTRLYTLVAVVHLSYSKGAAQSAVGPSQPIKGLPFAVGALESSPFKGKPRPLFLTAQEAARVRARIAETTRGKAIYDRIIAEAETQLEAEIAPIDEGCWQQAKDKPWGETYPAVAEHTSYIPSRYAKGASQLATAWFISDRRRYARRAV